MRIVLILPCCIGDVILATATLRALRRAYPDAHITWAVGSWSRPAVEHHPDLNAVLDTGSAALPVKSVTGFIRFVRQIRAGKFDLAVSLVRSPLMSLAVLLSGIPQRAGLDSNGRGFGYNIRARIDPNTPRHEAEIYLDVPRALGIDTSDCYANIPVTDADRAAVRDRLMERGYAGQFMVINPTGGRNPGMTLDIKRYPPPQLAALADRLASHYDLQIIFIGADSDAELIEATRAHLKTSSIMFAGELSFGQIAALAAESSLYIGNDTGITHLAAAAGSRTVMLMGPTDPIRYAPFAPHAIALWKPAPVSMQGVAWGVASHWDWSLHGIGVDEAEKGIIEFVARNPIAQS